MEEVMKKNSRKIGAAVVAAGLSLVLTFVTIASAAWWSPPTQLTDNSWSDSNPRISGNNVVWRGFGGPGNTSEIYFWDGSTVTNISNNGFHDYDPQISGNNVVWRGLGGPGNTSEIYFWDGSTVTNISDNDFHDYDPQISGNNVVWYGYGGPGNTTEIYHWNGSTVTNISNNNFLDYDPQISGNNVVWYGYGGNAAEIYHWNGSTVTNISNNDFDDYSPQISGDNVVWYGYGGPGDTSEIYLHDGSGVTRLTNNDFDDYAPRISGSNVVWVGEKESGNEEIFAWDGSTVTQLSDNERDDYSPRISGNKVVWVGDDGSDDEIFLAELDQQAPTDPTVTGSSPAKNAWTKTNTVKVDFSGATDNLSGVDGFSVSWTNSPLSVPNKVKDLGPGAVSATSPALADGTWYFHLRTVDKAGNWTNTVHYGPFKIDTAKPTRSLGAPKISTNVSKTTTFRVKWSGADALSGIASYQVQRKVGPKGTWKNWKTNTTARSAKFKAKPGTNHYFRVRSKDNAGNVSAWSKAKRTTVPYDNNSLISNRSGFGGLFKKASSGYYLGTTRFSTKKGETITYKFTGKSVALIGPKAKNRSQAKIYINGKHVKTIDARAKKLNHRKVLYSKAFKKGGTRTITIENLGTAGRSRFDVDGLAVGR
jgi:hypothetical protein